ncbi:MAG: lytic transglycosylase domain-containing protein [Roseburia sp.]|nr:lytic transglycosylase domain-containing protein [Roseburia sp.]
MKRQQKRKYDRRCMVFLIAIVLILAIHMIATTVRGKERKEQELEQQRAEQFEEMQQEELAELTVKWETVQQETETEPDRYAVFGTMSEDWGADDVEGFQFYEIPEEYQRTGGYMPEKMQIYTYIVCKNYGVRYELVIALIERESGYVFDKVGDDGHSMGYMQVYEDYHEDRMERLNCTDLMNPYQNILVGVDYLAELIEKYGTQQDALTAYNYGQAGAYRHMWSKGIYIYDYNSTIMKRAKEIEEVLQQ